MRWLPNALSLLRLALLLPYAWFFFQPSMKWPVFWLAVIIIASDKLDGTLARKFRVESKTGEFLDSFADTAFVLLTWFFFYIKGTFGLFLLILLLLPRPLSGIGYAVKRVNTKTWDLRHLQANRIGAVLNFAAILWLLAGLPCEQAMLWIMVSLNLLTSGASVYLRLRNLKTS